MARIERISRTLVLTILSQVAISRIAGAGEEFALRGAGASASWEGVFVDTVVAAPELCVAGGCQSFEITVEGADAAGGDQLLVALDESATVDGFDFLFVVSLYVYGPDGALVASSLSPFESQVAVVDGVVDGAYRAVVVPERVVGRLHYAGYAALRGTPVMAGRDLLPNLVPLPPANVQIEATPASFFAPFFWEWRGIRGPTSCYGQERIDGGAERCLRFDQSIANLGRGPLELRADQIGDGPMRQRVYDSDGGSTDYPVGDVELHLAHGHFHYADYAQAFLYEASPEGARGKLVRSGQKQGFCMADVSNVRFGTPAETPPSYTAPGLCDGRTEETGSQVGISVGWADTYPWYLADQFVEISGVPDGTYVLELVVNAAGRLRETSLEDNRAATRIRIRGNEVDVLERRRSPLPGTH